MGSISLKVQVAHQGQFTQISGQYAPEQVAEWFFSRDEADTLRTLPAVARVEVFPCWTRKEACIKALGEGLSRSIALKWRSVREFQPRSVM